MGINTQMVISKTFPVYYNGTVTDDISRMYCSDMGKERTVMIETDRLLLREYTLDDFDALYEIMSDPETMQHYPAPRICEGSRPGRKGLGVPKH